MTLAWESDPACPLARLAGLEQHRTAQVSQRSPWMGSRPELCLSWSRCVTSDSPLSLNLRAFTLPKKEGLDEMPPPALGVLGASRTCPHP